MSGHWEYIWIFLTAPLVGGLLAAALTYSTFFLKLGTGLGTGAVTIGRKATNVTSRLGTGAANLGRRITRRGVADRAQAAPQGEVTS